MAFVMKSALSAARLSVCLGALVAGAAMAQDGTAPQAEAQDTIPSDDIVVTARLRDENLMDVPVAVNAISALEIQKYDAGDLTKIGELTPTVIISNYKLNGGGSIAIRGISSPASQVGFEQPVSVSIDGVQTSSGKVAMLGFFDVQQVEVMKGPQALFFGKNSPAGVIALTTAGPTDTLQVGGRVGYEFVGNEIISEGYVSGPITDTFGARVAVKYRDLGGWLHNNGLAAANPFYRAGQPIAAANVPGRPSKKVKDHDLMGRLTLQFDPTDMFSATFKLFGFTGRDQGSGAYSQNIGPCADGRPRSFGVPDPYGDCKLDNQTSYGSISPGVAAVLPRAYGDGTARGKLDAYVGSLTLRAELGKINVTSTTGLLEHKYYSISALDQTIFGGLIVIEDTKVKSFSQELRALSDFDGPLNFLVGAYFQDSEDDLYNNGVFRNDISYNPANGRFDTYEKVAFLKGKTYSVFGQAIWDIMPDLELGAGLRWTHEKKRTRNQNIYGRTTALGAFDTSATIFPGSTDPTPGILAGTFKDNNLSPEVTLSWHPVANSTVYAAFKTGYKSGGFGISTPIQANMNLGDIDFDSETVSGFEVGAKGEFFDRRLRLTSAIFAYDFKNLQVTTYDAAAIRYSVNNAGKVRQRGIELEGDFRVTDTFKLHGAIAYVHNRIRDYTGACYGYTIPAASALTAAAPSGCSFVLRPDGSRFLTPAGTPVLQQVNDGRAPARSPDWSANAGFDLDVPINSAFEFGITGDAFYSSEYYASDSYSPASLQGSFWRFNASARIADPDGQWQVSLIGRNLTNKYYMLFAGDRTGGASVPLTPGEQRAVPSRGREILLQTSFKF